MIMRRFIIATLTASTLALTALPAGAAVAKSPQTVAALFQSSFEHEARGRHVKALNAVLRILRQDQHNYVATLRAGWLYYQRGRYVDSIGMYRRAVKLAPKALEPQLGLMLPLMAAKQWRDAEELGLRVLKKAPHNYSAASRLAYIAFSQGRFAESVTRYLAVLADFPSDLDMRMGLGWAYARQGLKAQARAQFQTVLAIRPDNVNAKSALQNL